MRMSADEPGVASEAGDRAPVLARPVDAVVVEDVDLLTVGAGDLGRGARAPDLGEVARVERVGRRAVHRVAVDVDDLRARARPVAVEVGIRVRAHVEAHALRAARIARALRGEGELAGVAEHDRLAEPEVVLAARADE